MTERGKFVVIYGVDGTGKSTTVGLLTGELINFRELEHYSDNPFSATKQKVLEEGSVEEQFLMYLASNLWQSRVIENLLSEGYSVTKDRWVLDIIGHHLHSGFDQAADVTSRFNVLQPDLSVLLTTDEETRLKRMEERGQLDGKDADLERARFLANFLYSRVALTKEKGLVIDNTDLTPEEVVEKIMEALK